MKRRALWRKILKETNDTYFLMCERKWVYHILIVVAGFFGAYTFLLRGNVFCNAQTGNVVLMGMALGAKKNGVKPFIM